jgi:golgi apparatus protein 1
VRVIAANHLSMALRLVLLAALAVTALGAKPSQELQDAIKVASEKQMIQEDAKTTSREVEFAPAANLTGGTGDVPTNGDCAEDIEIFCNSVKPGYDHIAECLNNQIFDEREGNSEYTVKVSKKCRAAVLKYKMELATNINLDVNMAAACKADAKRFCEYVKDFKFPGKVIACLREKKPSLKGKCRAMITRAQIEAAEDYRLDANLYDACKADAENVCKDVEAGSGRVNACLRKHRHQVRPNCMLSHSARSAELYTIAHLGWQCALQCMMQIKPLNIVASRAFVKAGKTLGSCRCRGTAKKRCSEQMLRMQMTSASA